MSRLRKGLHTVTVHPREKTTDRYGDTIYKISETGHTIQCNVQPVSADETNALAGTGITTVYRIKYWPNEHAGAPWPGGPYSRIIIENRAFEQRGEPLISRMSGTTGHTKIYAVAYDTEAK